jgi:chromosome segregation ATPase
VTEAEFLERFDRRIARLDEHVATGNAHMERGNVLMERVEEEMRLNREERAETRQFMRELTLRHERSTQQVVTQLAEQTAVLRDMHDEHIAFRKALFRVNDRLEDLRPEDLG